MVFPIRLIGSIQAAKFAAPKHENISLNLEHTDAICCTPPWVMAVVRKFLMTSGFIIVPVDGPPVWFISLCWHKIAVT
jgi:hypothetical protein